MCLIPGDKGYQEEHYQFTPILFSKGKMDLTEKAKPLLDTRNKQKRQKGVSWFVGIIISVDLSS